MNEMPFTLFKSHLRSGSRPKAESAPGIQGSTTDITVAEVNLSIPYTILANLLLSQRDPGAPTTIERTLCLVVKDRSKAKGRVSLPGHVCIVTSQTNVQQAYRLQLRVQEWMEEIATDPWVRSRQSTKQNSSKNQLCEISLGFHGLIVVGGLRVARRRACAYHEPSYRCLREAIEHDN